MARLFLIIAALPLVTLHGVENANAQSSSPWVSFTNQTGARLLASPSVGSACVEEKDFAWGDIDNDGDIDLICVRKQPWDTAGRRINVLFMNEGVKEGHAVNGVLVDRTVPYAAESDISGDQGFLTPTNDRDVKLLDVNGDGWLDIVTAVTLSDGQLKHISYPRVYINKGKDVKGNWQGFRYEDARMPQLAANAPSGFPHAPRFNHVAVGDINNDGLPDLYFADGDMGPQPQTHDFDNRLLLNVGGFFVDVTSTALPPAAQGVSNAVGAAMVDMNLDGAGDLIRHSCVSVPISVAIVYNDPASAGTFTSVQTVYQLSPTDLSVGDLNNDGRPDFVITDDGVDRFLLNLGNNGSGQATFQPSAVAFQAGGDDGFGGESVIADLDHDGFNDVIITDVDFNIAGCNRRAHIYRNLGNAPNVTLQEQSPSIIPVSMLTGTHDVAVFDLNGDGYNDVIFGRCTGITVWINHLSCPADVSGDATVNVNDLLAVINAWGPCAPGNCVADITGDNQVNVNDLLAVINAWGPCP